MSRREEYELRTEQLLQPIAEANGVSIYDIEYVKEGSDHYLRAYIDKPEGVNIQDCENVSRRLSDELDREDFIPEAYILEVSSPGLGRTLKKDKHLQAGIGQEVEIRLFKPIDKCRDFSGVLEGFDREQVTIRNEDTPITLKRADIAVIRLAIDF
ncbi:MAG: ribosome maturation factor RimP [Lachnospiraceae bacterium]|nr:ribosome maturation factor RimP [Lachnospiraceae bacterium]